MSRYFTLLVLPFAVGCRHEDSTTARGLPDFGVPDVGEEGEPEQDGALGLTWGDALGLAGLVGSAYDDQHDAFALAGNGAVTTITTDGEVLASVALPGVERVRVVDGLVLAWGGDELYGWRHQDGAHQMADVATAYLVTDGVFGDVARVGDDLWISTLATDGSSEPMIYEIGLGQAEELIGEVGDLDVVASTPCGAEIATCGLTMAPAPDGDGALLSMSAGYVQHVTLGGESDWFVATSGQSYTGTAPASPGGLTRVEAVGDRYFVSGHLDGDALPPAGRWLTLDGEIDENAEMDPWAGAWSIAHGEADGVVYEAYGSVIGAPIVGIDAAEGVGALSSVPVDGACLPRVTTNGGDVLLVACEEGDAFLATVAKE